MNTSLIKKENNREGLKIVMRICTFFILPQFISLAIATTAITSEYLILENVEVPSFQNTLSYIAVFIMYSIFHFSRTKFLKTKGEQIFYFLKRKQTLYCFLLSILDVFANYMIVKAYQHATITTVQLLDTFIIPTVIVASIVILKTLYSWLHFLATFIAVFGMGMFVYANYLVIESGHNSVTGYVLTISAAVFYGLQNVNQEKLLQNIGQCQYLTYTAFFSIIISSILTLSLESKKIQNIDFHNSNTIMYLSIYVLSMGFLYSIIPIVLRNAGACVLNLNILSSDVYSLLAGIYFFHNDFMYMHFIGFGIIILGILIFNIQRTKQTINKKTVETPNEESSHLNV
ncbi:Solute carrier family 35 member F2 [Intoshia linei]|uniref:Solute carrier family 35 member F2 n=1 Tax=Intoshia linei TaxID=1819745 RepID=A0A177AVU0_9BILA|nr:Solute carrier family 35 member F2 [Intoshia linei]